ncbi:hypothetical protein LCGC14_2898800, partial [marine sediment metagenome]
LTLAADGSFVYRANADFHGTDTFTYIAADGQLDSNVATVTVTVNQTNDAPVDDVPPARDLGGILVVELPHLNPSQGDLWFGFQTTRDALITLWVQNSNDVTITLYDANLNEVALWTPGNGNQRIEYPAEAGQQFYFRLSGTDTDVNVHLANVIKLNGSRRTSVDPGETDGDGNIDPADVIEPNDDYVTLFGTGSYNSVKYRDEVHARADADDVAGAFLYDSVEDDRLEDTGSSGRLVHGLSSASTGNAQQRRTVRCAKGAGVEHDRAVDLILTIESPGRKLR